MCWQEFGEVALWQGMETVRPLGKTAWRASKMKQRITTWPSNSASVTTLRRIGSRDSDGLCLHLCSRQHFPQLSKVEMPMDGWCGLSKQWLLFTLKEQEILTQATSWMDPEDMILGEISLPQRDKRCLIPLIWGPQRSHIRRDGKPQRGDWGLGEGSGRLGFSRDRLSVWKDEKALTTTVIMTVQNISVLNAKKLRKNG